MKKSEQPRISQCLGRFPEARTCIEEVSNLLIAENYRSIDSVEDLNQILDLYGKNDLLYLHDLNDSYFNNRVDILRTDPLMGDLEKNLPSAILPLIAKEFRQKGIHVSETLMDSYPRIFGALERTVNGLRLFHKSRKDLSDQLGIDLSKVVFPIKEGYASTTTLPGYHLEGDFGIGGTGAMPIVSDCPYMVYLVSNKTVEVPEKTSLGIGFWYNADDTLLVAQIQAARGGKMPKDIYPGILGLQIATQVARKIGSKKIQTYAATNNPIFLQHPGSRHQFEGELKCYFDKAARTLGWAGTHGEYFELDLTNSENNAPNKNIKRKYTRDPKGNPCAR